MFDPDHQRFVRHERNGWRDAGISERHRCWGFNCPAVDLDFVLCEYDAGRAYAIVEYKCETAAPIHYAHPTIRALRDLGNRANLPVFLTIYSRDFSRYRVIAVNYLADKKLVEPLESKSKPRDFNEGEYVAFLLALRGRLPNGQLF